MTVQTMVAENESFEAPPKVLRAEEMPDEEVRGDFFIIDSACWRGDSWAPEERAKRTQRRFRDNGRNKEPDHLQTYLLSTAHLTYQHM